MKVHLTLKLKVHRARWPVLVRLVTFETALQGRGNLCGSGHPIGISFCIHAGTVNHVENYSNYLWVRRDTSTYGFTLPEPFVHRGKVTKRATGPLFSCRP